MNSILRVICALCLVLALPLSSLAAAPGGTLNSSAADIAGQLQQGRQWTILDVRTPAEYAAGHVQHALNIDAMDAAFADTVAKLPKDATYMVYCRSARRSAKAVATMENLGFTHIIHMADGILGWQKARLPLVQP